MTFADAAAELAPGQALKIRDIQVQGAQDALGARVYTAGVPGAGQPNLMVFFHGGGFVDGDLDDADDFLRCLAGNPDHVVLAANYTLARCGLSPPPWKMRTPCCCGRRRTSPSWAGRASRWWCRASRPAPTWPPYAP
jgi:hypothetical protein